MRLLLLTTVYPRYMTHFYERHPGLASKEYAAQRDALRQDAYSWIGVWPNYLAPHGFDADDVIMNIAPVQRAWARENGLKSWRDLPLEDIAVARIKQAKPDVLWCEVLEERLLRRIRVETPSVRLVLGWVGSAIPNTRVWESMDLVLSCAPESVEYFAARGIRSGHFNHGFDPRINARLKRAAKTIDAAFVGQIARGRDFHQTREQMLEEIVAAGIGLRIFSSSYEVTLRDAFRACGKIGLYYGAKGLTALGVEKKSLEKLPGMHKALTWTSRPQMPSSNPRLNPFVFPPVFGLPMYQALRDSNVGVNIHADSSPTHASNMKLFETTGVGTCLVTDWKNNISQLFEPGKEVVTYRSASECAENIRWLLDNPSKREEIARAGQARTLKDHSFATRAHQLTAIINHALLGRRELHSVSV